MILNAISNKGGNCRPYSFERAKYFFFFASFLFSLAPLFPDHYFPWLTFHSDFIATLALLVLSLGVAIRFKKIEIPVSVLVIFVVAFIPVLQTILGQIKFSGDGVLASAYLFGFAVSVIAGRQLFIDFGEKFLLTFSVCAVSVAVVSVLIETIQWLSLDLLGAWVMRLREGDPPYANIGQPNNLATLLCIALISLIYIRERGTVAGWSASLLAVILLFGLALTQCRTAWIIVAMFVLWWLWRHKSLQLKLSRFEVVGCVVLYVALINVLPVVSDYLYLSSASEQVRSAEVGVRGVIWMQLLDAVWQGPFWGYGWNQLSYAQLIVAADPGYSNSLYVEHSHNLFIDLLVWNGPVLGGILILVIVWWGLKQVVSCGSLSGWYGLACVGALSVHSMLEFPNEYAYFLFPIGLIVGSVIALQSSSSKVFLCPRWLMLLTLVVSGVFIGMVFSEYRKIEEDSRLLRFEAAKIGFLKAEEKAPDVKILTQLREFLRFSRTEARTNMSLDEIEWMEAVAHRYAYPPALFRYSLALFLNNKPEEAQEELIKLRQLHGEQHYFDAKANLILMADKYPQLQSIDY